MTKTESATALPTTARSTMQITPLAGCIGAEVTGVDLASVDDAQFDQIHAALLDHLVLAFRDQNHLTPDEHKAFASRWGELDIHGYATPISDEHPEILSIANRGKKYTITETWHTDVTWKQIPPMASLLLGREVPGVGGDTMFANQYEAYESLSDGMKATVDNLRAVHRADLFAKFTGKPEAPPATHPVVRTHPETGRRSLFVNAAFTRYFEGWTVEESNPLLRFLYERAHRPDFTMRHRWRTGDLVMWDNRCTQHYAIHDHGDAVRDMHRVTVLDSAEPA